MPNIFHQSVEDILKAATPEQRLLWNYIFLRFGERVPISQLFYIGTAGEFTLYNANKLYVSYSLDIQSNGAAVAGLPNVVLYNELNAVHATIGNSFGYWDATAAAARYGGNHISLSNYWFSRILINGGYSQIRFIGYRIGI